MKSQIEHSSILAISALNYSCMTCCSDNFYRKYYCPKESWLCQQCNQNSTFLRYIYFAKGITLCVYHYQWHFNPLIHYWKDNVLTIYDSKTKSKKMLELNMSIINSDRSISVGNMIFFIGGGFPASSKTYKVNFFKTIHLPPKNQCILQSVGILYAMQMTGFIPLEDVLVKPKSSLVIAKNIQFHRIIGKHCQHYRLLDIVVPHLHSTNH